VVVAKTALGIGKSDMSPIFIRDYVNGLGRLLEL